MSTNEIWGLIIIVWIVYLALPSLLFAFIFSSILSKEWAAAITSICAGLTFTYGIAQLISTLLHSIQ